MKKSNILIAVFAVMAAVSVSRAEDIKVDFDGKKSAGTVQAEDMKIDFDGKKSSPLLGQLSAQAQKIPAAEAAIMPMRVFTAMEQASMDKSIDSAIIFIQKRQMSPALLAGFECLRNGGTLEQKAAFVYGRDNAAYEFPAVCVAAGRLSAIDKGILNDGLQWLCESYNDVIEYLSCHKGPDGEEVCDVELRTILRTSCHWG